MHIAGSCLSASFEGSSSRLVSIVPRLVLDRNLSSNDFVDLLDTCVRRQAYCINKVSCLSSGKKLA